MAKNLGQIAGLFVGSSAPTNTTLIWYDTASHVHKVYNTSLAAWTVLDQQAISNVTYSELVNRAGTTGLTQGQWFKITDRSNALALAITSTKVQYADNSGALIVNDLGTSISYHITSTNLLIDDINGVYSTTTGKLVFSFEEDIPSMSEGEENIDYIMGQSKRGVNKSLKKWRIRSFLSSDANNALSWSGGFFLNFAAKLRSFFDIEGGVTSKETFDNFQQTQQQTIQQLAQNELNAIQQVGTNIAQEVTPAKIYDKKLPTAPTSGIPVDIALGDKLGVIINKIYRWIAKFKNSDGINVGSNFVVSSANKPVINNSDTVQSALSKTQKNISDLNQGGEKITVGNDSADMPTLSNAPTVIKNNNTLKEALQKLYYWVTHVNQDRVEFQGITESKMAVGVFPTDILRIDIQSSDDLTGCGFGGVMIAGDQGLFVSSAQYPNNPYRIATYWDAGHWDCPILAFSPVTLVVTNNENQYTVAAPMPHYKGHLGLDDSIWFDDETHTTLYGAYLQSQIHLSQSKYDALYGAGKRYVKITTTAVDVYGADRTPANPIMYLSLQRVNIWNLTFPVADFAATAEKHVIVKFTVEFTETN